MNVKSIAILLAVTSATLCSVEPAQAWRKWFNARATPVTMRAAKVSFPQGSSWANTLQYVIQRFNNNPSNFKLGILWNDTSFGFNNGQNEIWWSSSISAPAVTYAFFNSRGVVDETDVVFNNRKPYTTSMRKTSLWAFGGSLRPFETTALHELGHVAGLDHEPNIYNIMGQDWTFIHCNSGTARSYVGEDAGNGMVQLYGRDSARSIEDVSVSVFERFGSSGGYSRHRLTEVDTQTGSFPYNTQFNGQPLFHVYRNTPYAVEFNYENNGENRQVVRVGLYLSTNSYISTYDRLLTSVWVSMSRDVPLTLKRWVRIPSDLTTGRTYYVGAVIDDTRKLSEVDESNNAGYHQIKIY